ncbi:MAG: aminoglycoside phosphotransferase family protein [Caldilineaceae bacterium]|nr:phosphotransferase [Caldilineaceae bacterium]
MIHTADLHPLLAHLAAVENPSAPWTWQGWQIHRVGGGMNNRLYCARPFASGFASVPGTNVSGSDPNASLAVKFTMNDGRDRAGREWNALHVLAEAGLSIAPRPILLDRERYAWPVVVQSWVDGEAMQEPPHADADWEALLAHLRTVHALTADRIQRPLPNVVLFAATVGDAFAAIDWQLDLLPPAERPPQLVTLLEDLHRCRFPSWDAPALTLCRADPNIRNFIRRDGPWVSVDWEYSGLGDPAFEIADLIAHIAHLEVPAERWHWFVDRYVGGEQHADPLRTRIETYLPLMLVWWVVRIARYLHETERGLDKRLVAPEPGWRATKEQQLSVYFERASRALAPWRAR